MAHYLELLKVIKRKELLTTLDMNKSTLDRLEARGEGPPKTKLSKNRIGCRVCDVKEWLDRRRMGQAAAILAIGFFGVVTLCSMTT